ncbi:Imm26 family immunity protein [Ruminococcus sp. FC2018]|uniref:Imm26 family immunity protein n=1 Tax=Ruminococcus sp. FC2018 TaxID=1410617 RepID=UPI0012DBD6A6|nr:Imm26 family immunity protein [Ruminococcus sp. FC2018]
MAAVDEDIYTRRFLRAMNNEGNILAQAWKKRYEALAPDIQKRLDDLSRHFDRGESDHYKLQYIKKSYVLPETGDVFVCKPVNDLYYCGVVLNAHIKNMIGDDMYVVLIFNSHSDSIDKVDFTPDYENTLLEPQMISRALWTKGWFKNIMHIEDLGDVPSYGFYKYCYDHPYWDEYDNKIDKRPEYLTIGATTVYGLGYEITKELIISGQV